MHLNFSPATKTISGLQPRVLPGIIPTQTCPTGRGVGPVIPKCGIGRLRRATSAFILIPGVLLQWAIRRQPGMPRRRGILRPRVPGVAEAVAVVGTLAADGVVAVVDSVVVECIPVAVEHTSVVAWPMAAAVAFIGDLPIAKNAKSG